MQFIFFSFVVIIFAGGLNGSVGSVMQNVLKSFEVLCLPAEILMVL